MSRKNKVPKDLVDWFLTLNEDEVESCMDSGRDRDTLNQLYDIRQKPVPGKRPDRSRRVARRQDAEWDEA